MSTTTTSIPAMGQMSGLTMPGKHEEDQCMRTIEQAKQMLEELGRMQEQGQTVDLRCPRCGYPRMRDRLVENSLSRRADVHICNVCGMDEALRDMAGSPPLPLNEWSIVCGFNGGKEE